MVIEGLRVLRLGRVLVFSSQPAQRKLTMRVELAS